MNGEINKLCIDCKFKCKQELPTIVVACGKRVKITDLQKVNQSRCIK